MLVGTNTLRIPYETFLQEDLTPEDEIIRRVKPLSDENIV